MVHIERFIEVSQVLGVIIVVVFAAVVAVVAYSASDFVVHRRTVFGHWIPHQRIFSAWSFVQSAFFKPVPTATVGFTVSVSMIVTVFPVIVILIFVVPS